MAKNAVAKTWNVALRSDGQRYSKPPIVAPTLAVVVDSSTQLTVTASGASSTLGSISGYLWYRNGQLLSPTPSASPRVDTGLLPATQYSYAAVAVDGAGNLSAASAAAVGTTNVSSDTTAPSVPTSLVVSVINSTTLRVVFIGSTDTGGSGLAGYRIERSSDGGATWTRVAEQAGVTFDNTGLQPSTTYRYRVAAYDQANNQSAFTTSVQATTPASGTINLVINATRTSGVAPLSVVFDTIGTTHSDGAVDPWRNLGHWWVFGDPNSGTWPFTGHSKNAYKGAGAALHVFETPGTYTVKCRVLDPNGNAVQNSINVTVADPNTVYSGQNTICISRDSDTTGAPAGAQLITNATSIPAFVSGKRYLFKRGQDFRSLSGSLSVAQRQDVQVGAFGTGARPILNGATVQSGNPDNSGFNWPDRNVFMDLDLRGSISATTSHRNTLFLRCRVNPSTGRPANVGADILYYMAAAGSTAKAALEWPQNFHLVETDLIDGDPTNTVGIWNYSRGTWLVGCEVNPQQEHCVRFPLNDRGGVQHCYLHGVGGVIRHAVKWHAVGLNPFNVKPSVEIGPSSRYGVVGYNNYGFDEPAGTDWGIVIGPQNGTSVEGTEDIIVEANVAGFNYDAEIVITGRNIVARGNTMAPSIGGSPNIGTGGHQDALPTNWRGPYHISTAMIPVEEPI